MNNLRCPTCSASRDSDDNFCRRCGRQITVNLPAVRESALPATTSPGIPPSLAGSIAVLAIGTGLEWLARRLAGGAARGAARAAGRALTAREASPPARTSQTDDAVVVKEMLYIREVNLRR